MSQHLYPQLASRVFGVPLAMHPLKAKVIAEALAPRFGIDGVTILDAGGRPMAGDWWDDEDEERMRAEAKPDPGYDLVQGVAVIHIEGTLVHRTRSVRTYSGMLGYNAIRSAFLAAVNDPEVRAIVLLCNSPGGEVSGCFDLVDLIHSARGMKPIWSICDDMAYSACYAIASAADRVILPRTGGAGSVGVITMHADWSKALDGAGVAVTIFQHGARKAAGNPYQPLTELDKAEFQGDIDALGDLFDETAARNRGLKVARVRDMQARCYMGAAGVDAGLADAVMAPDEAFRVLLSELG